MFKRQETRPDMPGYFPKNQNRYRYCNDFHDEGFRCTRPQGHKGPHAAHTTMGVEGTTETIRNEANEVVEIRVKPGMKNTQDVQIATWDERR
jgi:hypothetical protein